MGPLTSSPLTGFLFLHRRRQPTKAYFGQKDIQQALLLRRMLTDLHVPAPLASNLVIIPTYRDTVSELALSSRNAYLRAEERPWATVLIDALHMGQQVWDEQRATGDVNVNDVLEAARESVRAVEQKAQAEGKGVEVRLIYVAMNDPEELWDLEKAESATVPRGKGAVLSGAVMLGRTRLIDNLVFDYPLN
jgi:pantoate--beta-alanine ligase